MPDVEGLPVWLPLLGEEAEPSSPPDLSVSDNESPAWLNTFDAAHSSGQVVFWGGGTYLEDGTQKTFGGQWVPAPLTDADSDGIPNGIDLYPADSSNNSFEWVGGVFTFHGIRHAFRSDWYAGTATDANSDGLPDCLMHWFTDPSSQSIPLQSWAGGSFLIEGAWNSFDPVSYYAYTQTDTDGDGLPDELDPAPSDSWNGTYFYWQGGSFPISGQMTTFEPQNYGGIQTDQDNDGIPDAADPAPSDPSNGSSWWQGGSYQIAGSYVHFDGRWLSGSDTDMDWDGLPDSLDPYPYDGNNTPSSSSPTPVESTWTGGSYYIDGSLWDFPAHSYTYWQDSDNDGIPDNVDPYGSDSSNNTSYWGGGYYFINHYHQWLEARYHRADSPDSDQDGIPNDCDPFPSDPENNSGQQTFYWAGGSYWINAEWQTLPGGTYEGTSSDLDIDGIPDAADPHLDDPQNNTAFFHGGVFEIDNILTPIEAPEQSNPLPYRTDNGDLDADGIPNAVDPYPEDHTNHSGFIWPEYTTYYSLAGGPTEFVPTYYGGAYSDADADGIPDAADPYPSQSWNGDLSLDSDADGLPDHVEADYPELLDKADPTDAEKARADGITYLQAYQYGPQLNQDLRVLINVEQDADRDLMPDLYETINSLDPNDRTDAAGLINTQYLFNLQRYQLGVPHSRSVDGNQYQQLTGVAPFGFTYEWNLSTAEQDWDEDNISNIDELVVFKTSPTNSSERPSETRLIEAMLANDVSANTRLKNIGLISTGGNEPPDEPPTTEPPEGTSTSTTPPSGTQTTSNSPPLIITNREPISDEELLAAMPPVMMATSTSSRYDFAFTQQEIEWSPVYRAGFGVPRESPNEYLVPEDTALAFQNALTAMYEKSLIRNSQISPPEISNGLWIWSISYEVGVNTGESSTAYAYMQSIHGKVTALSGTQVPTSLTFSPPNPTLPRVELLRPPSWVKVREPTSLRGSSDIYYGMNDWPIATSQSFWLVRNTLSRKPMESFSITSPLVTKTIQYDQVGAGQIATVVDTQVTTATLTLLAADEVSNVINLSCSIKRLSGTSYRVTTQSLVPVEILQAEANSSGEKAGPPEPVTSVRMCRWLGAYYGFDTVDLTKFPRDDPDLFVVRVPRPDKIGVGALTAKLSTKYPKGVVVDQASDIILIEAPANSGNFESMPLALVADNDDDEQTPNEEFANDVTHHGVLGGKIIISLPDLQNAEFEFPIKKESHTLNIDFLMIPPPTGSITLIHSDSGVGSVSLDETEYAGIYLEQQKRCRDLYEQLGVKVTSHRESVGAPSGAIKTAIESGSFDAAALMSEVKAIYGSLKEADHVMVVMVPAFFGAGKEWSAGLTPTSEDGWCFVSLPWIKKVVTKKGTSAHEVGHTLGLSLDAFHSSGKMFNIPRKLHELMSDSSGRGISGDPARDGKRFVWEDVKDLQLLPNAKAVKYLLPSPP